MYTEPGSALDSETAIGFIVCLDCLTSASSRRSVRVHWEAGECLRRAHTVFALSSRSVHTKQGVHAAFAFIFLESDRYWTLRALSPRTEFIQLEKFVYIVLYSMT